MECNYKPVDWSEYPPIEKCTSFGDTNNNKLDIAINGIDSRMTNWNRLDKYLEACQSTDIQKNPQE